MDDEVPHTTRIGGTSRLEGESSLVPPVQPTIGASSHSAGPLQLQTFTLDDAFEQIGFGRTQILMFFFVGMAWAGDGMEMMLLSYLGPELRCKWDLSPSQESWITSAVFIGMMFGSYTWGAVSDAYGRKVGFFAPALFTALFGVLSAIAPSYEALLFFRACVGFGIAGAHVAYTLFMEYLAPTHRGKWLTFIEFFWTLGSIFLAGMAWVVLPSRFGWRGLVVLAAMPLALLMALYPFVKESPHWLLAHGHTSRAQDVLQWAAKVNGKHLPVGQLVHHTYKAPAEASKRSKQPNGDPVMSEVELDAVTPEIVPQVPASSRAARGFEVMRASFHEMLANHDLAVTSGLLVIVWLAVALSYYGLILFNMELQANNNNCTEDGRAEFSTADYRDVFITSFGEVGGLVLTMLLVDWIGRRRCMWGFLLATAAFLTPLLRPEGPGSNPTVPNPAVIDVVCLFFTRFFTFGGFIVLFIYTPEVYPTSVRSFSFGLYNAFCRAGGLVAPFVAVDLLDSAGTQASAAIFFGACLIAAVAAMLLPIETLGRALAEDAKELELQLVNDHAPAKTKRSHRPKKDVDNPFHTDSIGDRAGKQQASPRRPFSAQDISLEDVGL